HVGERHAGRPEIRFDAQPGLDGDILKSPAAEVAIKLRPAKRPGQEDVRSPVAIIIADGHAAADALVVNDVLVFLRRSPTMNKIDADFLCRKAREQRGIVRWFRWIERSALDRARCGGSEHET